MSALSRKQFEELKHAYELDLLSEEDRQRFELYLLEHEDLIEEMKDFQKIVDALQRHPFIKETINGLAGEPAPKRSRKLAGLTRVFVPSVAVGFAVFLLLVFKPWKIEIQPDLVALAAQNRIAIMNFANVVNPDDTDRYGMVSANLLIADLEESRYLQVVPSQRLAGILGQLGLDDSKAVDRETAIVAAGEADARWLIVGSILQQEPAFRLHAELLDAGSGDQIGAFTVDGIAGQPIFDVVDRLSAQVKGGLPLPAAAMREIDRPVTEVTTHSMLAYRLYLEGAAAFQKYYREDARRAFELALAYDSTLAMAWYYLSALVDESYIEQAVRYAEHASHRERLYIAARQASLDEGYDSTIAILEEIVKIYPDEKQAFNLLGTYLKSVGRETEAIENLLKAIAIDPDYKFPYNTLAYIYNVQGQVDKAIEAIDKYIELAPDEANPLDTKGDIYLYNGNTAAAIAAYRKALLIKPDFHTSKVNLGHAYFFLGEFDSARVYYDLAARTGDYQSFTEARLYTACISVYFGRTQEALQLLDDYITADRVENGMEQYPSYRFVKAHIYEELGDTESAADEITRSLKLNTSYLTTLADYTEALYGEFMVRLGRISEARRVADKFRQRGPTAQHCYRYVNAALAAAEGDYHTAIEEYSRAIDADIIFHIPGRFALGRIYIQTGRFDEAAAVFDRLISNYDMDYTLWSLLIVKSRYYLGTAYEALQRYDDAARQYRAFLDVWKEADFDSWELKEARARLTRLQSRT